MRQRLVTDLLQKRLAVSPAVALIGPRQCGKTTLARSLGGVYYDLEQPAEQVRLDLEWPALVASETLAVFDEAQAWPGLFLRLRGAIDNERERNGRFLVLGSVSPSLMTHVAESLAGRLALVELTPFLWSEVADSTHVDELWLAGGFPDGAALKSQAFPRWQHDYLTLLAQRDLPSWGLAARPQQIERLLRMVAAVNAQQWNASQVGQSLGVTYHTVNSYLDYLTGAFVVRSLEPYSANIRKRLVKRSKVFVRDTGLLHALLNISTRDALLGQPWVGASWEGFVIEQVLGDLLARGTRHQAAFFRTSDQHEIDLVLDFGNEVWAIEIKLTTAPGPDDLHRLDRAAALIGAQRRFLVSQSTVRAGDERRASLNLPALLEMLP